MGTFTIIGAGGIFTCGLLAYFGRESVRLRSELGSETIRLVLMDIDEMRLSHLIGALWGNGQYEVAWQGRHAGNIPGLPEGVWLEHTMQVDQGRVLPVDFNPLPDEVRAQISLLAIQNQAMVRAVIADDLEQGIRALAINPFTCDLPKARAYLRDIWAG